jgi:fructose-1,6-bisphosphatase I
MAEHETYLTLDRFLVQRQRAHHDASGELTRVLEQVGVVAKIISRYMRRAAREGLRGLAHEVNVQGEEVEKLDKLGNSIFAESFEYVDIIGALISEEVDEPMVLSSGGQRGKYVVLVDPIDGSSNLDVDCVIGSIFSIRRLDGSIEASVLRRGTEQVAAGYVMYGTSTLLVYTAGDGLHSFVLDQEIGEFVLDHAEVRMPERGETLAVNFGNDSRWTGQTRSFMDSLRNGERGKYSLRYSGALVADLHQILHRGGLYCYPEEHERPQGKLRLLYECAPLAMVAEQAGGAATTGEGRVLDVQPRSIHQRVPFAIGSRYEVDEYQRAHVGS